MSGTKPDDAWLRDNALKVLEAVVDAVVTMDASGIIRYANEAAYRMFRHPPGSLIGKPVTIFMPPAQRQVHQSDVDNYLRTGEAKIIGIGRELVGETSDGHRIPLYLAVSRISSPEGTYFTGIMRDLTQSKLAQEALLEQQERLARVGRLSTMGEMTASIAHEINQPLTAIAMYAQACIKLLQNPDTDRQKLTTALEKLNRQSLRAGAIIERIQRFVRNESGQRELCGVNSLIRELTQFVTGDARLHDIDLQFDLAEDLPNLFCDPIQIQQVALNLIRNAIDAMHQIERIYGDTVVVRSRLIDDTVEVAVVDAGTGVSVDDEPLVFSAFHTTKKDGMGMGLSICRSIIEQHGGKLSFFNNPEHGATFYFRLPVGGNDGV
ncbi:MAG: PAS domain S-box protein [Pseudomonadales bacterium]|nr:PAS domain S-box protein [Pseudomonadales bacterium]MCP5182642.1 PAS domain S-box protein [Pseudomonadales bacterium]